MPLSDEALAQVLQMLRAGNYVGVAARAAGISENELLEELEVRQALDRASAEGEARNVTQVAQAARSNWQAAAWLLERSYPERWGRSQPGRQTDEVAPPGVTADAIDELAGKRSARRASG